MQHNRRDGGEWPASYDSRCNDLPRLILILNGDLIVKRTAGQFPAVLILYDAIEALD